MLTNGSYADAIAMRLGHLEARMRDETGFVVMGGTSEPLATYLKERHDPTSSLEQVGTSVPDR